MARPGLHWPNATESTPAMFDRFRAGLFPSAVVMTVSPASTAAWLVEHARLVVARIYEPAGNLPAPSDVAARHESWIREAGVRYVKLLNEPDLEYPDLTPEAFAIWWGECALALRTRMPWLLIGFPGPSIGASSDYMKRVAAVGGLARADWIGDSGYWQLAADASSLTFGWRWERSIEFGLPVIVCEFGCTDGRFAKSAKSAQYLSYAASLPRCVAAVGAFIGSGGDPHWDSVEAGSLWIDDGMCAEIGAGVGVRVMNETVVSNVRRYVDPIRKYAYFFKLAPSIVAGLIAVESGGLPRATSPDNGPGLGHARGLMQVLEGNFAPNEDGYDPETNIRVGCGMLRAKMDRFGGRLDSGLAAYFGAVDDHGNPTGGSDLTGTTGIQYVGEIHAAAAAFADLGDSPEPVAPIVPPAVEVDEAFRSYAPSSGTWREAAINLKGIADDALTTGRRIVADSAAAWGAR